MRGESLAKCIINYSKTESGEGGDGDEEGERRIQRKASRLGSVAELGKRELREKRAAMRSPQVWC